MDYLQSIGAQTAIFLKTVGFGFLLGAGYDLLRLVRMLLRARRIAIWDICFGAFSGAATFLFALTQNGGKVRVFFLLAVGVGIAVWYCTAGVPFRAATDRILHAGRRAAACVRRPVARFSIRFENMRGCLCAFGKKVLKSCKKNRKSS